MKKLNSCRLYLQVTFLSKITTIRDDEVLSSALTGERNTSQHSIFHWPKQKRPDIKTWKLWNKTISKIHCGDKLLKLQSAFCLLRWILPPSKRSANYHYQFSPIIQEIYIYILVYKYLTILRPIWIEIEFQ